MERQRRLRGEDAVELRAVVAEEALHRIVGDQQVMQVQLQHLLEAGELPNVIPQVLPFDAGAQPCPAGPFVVLSFPGADNEDIGYTDTPLGGHIVEEATDVAALRNLFDEVRSLALPGNCVEVGATQGTVGVRDTKDRRSDMLEINRVAWTAFVRALKEGRLDV